MSRRPRHEPESSSVSIAWFLALAAYCVALPLLLELALPADSSGQPSVWELELLGARGFRASALAFGVRTLIRMTLLVPIGFFAALTLPRQSRWFRRVLMVSIPAGGIAVVLAFVVSGFAGGSGWEAPRLLTLALPAMAALVGVWIGVCASNGLGSFILFFPKFAVLVVAVGLIAVAFFYLATEDYPLDLKTPQLSTDIRRELVTRFRGHNPMKLRLGETRTLTVSAQDLERLAAWGVSVTPATSQLAIQTSSESAYLQASTQVPYLGRYLNVSAVASGGVQQGELQFSVRELRFGSIETPGILLSLISSLAMNAASHDEAARSVLDSIEELRFEVDGVSVTYRRMDVRGDILPRVLAQLGPDEAVLEAARAQLEHLHLNARNWPEHGRRFEAAVQSAFALAHERSAASNPIVENSGAILALAAVLGHPRLQVFSGLNGEERMIRDVRGSLRNVKLRGRADWTQHFFVSAGLTQLSSVAVSDAVGVLKEELDADVAEGGSGFSFADLLADRAGTRFAERSTYDATRAEAMQLRLKDGFAIGNIFPEADGLREGISDDLLRVRYGGVGGAEDQQVSQDIERRLATCDALR